MGKKTKGIQVRNKVIDIEKADKIVNQTDYSTAAPADQTKVEDLSFSTAPAQEPLGHDTKSKETAPAAKYPWEMAIPEQKSNILVQLDGVTYAKLKYLKSKLPNFSLRKFAIQTVTEQTEKLIDEMTKN